MRILITGAAGFIGSHLVERRLTRGDEVVGLDCFDDFYDPAIKRANLAESVRNPAFSLLEADIRDADMAERLPGEIDVIVHLAARAGVRPSIAQPLLYQSVNLEGTGRLLELARETGVRRFVFGSSSSVYGNSDRVPFAEDDPVDSPISPYAATKRAGELLCHAHHHLFDIDVLALRFFTVYGPRQRPDLAIHKFVSLLEEGRPIPRFGDGSSSRDYTYVDDIVDGMEGALDLLQSPSGLFEIINLGGSDPVRLDALIASIGEVMGVEPVIEQQGDQPGDVRRTHADISKAGRLLGYEPSTPIREGLARFVDWYRSRRAR